MKTSTKKPARRTRAEIALLSVEAIQAELVAEEIRPIEFVTVENDRYLYDYMNLPKLQPHQRWDFAEWAPRASDPFVMDYYTRFPPDDLRTMWREQLYTHELHVYIDGLSRAQLVTQLKTITVDSYFDKTPEAKWTTNDYREELRARLKKLEDPDTKRKRRST